MCSTYGYVLLRSFVRSGSSVLAGRTLQQVLLCCSSKLVSFSTRLSLRVMVWKIRNRRQGRGGVAGHGLITTAWRSIQMLFPVLMQGFHHPFLACLLMAPRRNYHAIRHDLHVFCPSNRYLQSESCALRLHSQKSPVNSSRVPARILESCTVVPTVQTVLELFSARECPRRQWAQANRVPSGRGEVC